MWFLCCLAGEELAGLGATEPLGLQLVGSGSLVYLAELLSIGQLCRHHHPALLLSVGSQGGTVSRAAVLKTSTH